MPKLAVLSGAGISAESGIPTFRDSGGLWEGHDVMTVASPEGWAENPELVLDFYNQRRKQALEATPNDGHKVLAELEAHFHTVVITQNVDDLHERAGSTNVLHLHGSLFETRSTLDESLVYPTTSNTNLGDMCEKGSQLRPNIVWFGEMVPMLEVAVKQILDADVFLVVGTSLQVYPAASLIHYVPSGCKKFIVDPKAVNESSSYDVTWIPEGAGIGLRKVKEQLLTSFP